MFSFREPWIWQAVVYTNVTTSACRQEKDGGQWTVGSAAQIQEKSGFRHIRTRLKQHFWPNLLMNILNRLKRDEIYRITLYRSREKSDTSQLDFLFSVLLGSGWWSIWRRKWELWALKRISITSPVLAMALCSPRNLSFNTQFVTKLLITNWRSSTVHPDYPGSKQSIQDLKLPVLKIQGN